MKDQFDEFLINEIRKAKLEIPDKGFSERIVKGISKRIPFYRKRGFIITSFIVLAVFVFLVIMVKLDVLTQINFNINPDGSKLSENINYSQYIIIAMFFFMLVVIPLIETEEEV